MSSLSPSALSRTALPFEGEEALRFFQLAPDRIHLNNGSFGAVPRSVEAAQARWRAEIERDPTTFLDEVYPAEVRRAAAIAARGFGGEAQDWVFCENATSALAGVLAAFPLKPGDEMLTTSHAYGAVVKAMRLWAQRSGAALRFAELPSILDEERQVVEAVMAAFTERTRLLVIDHITSPTAAVFPVAEIVRAARAAGIAVFVDGAHTLGQIGLNVPALGADWYTGNAHKWFFAPRGCGLLWTAPGRQEMTRPAVPSHGTDKGYTEAFDWIGTRDVTPWLCLAAAAQAFEEFGGKRLIARNRQLAAEAVDILVTAVGGAVSAPLSMRAAMATICFPVKPAASADAHLKLRASLREKGMVVAANVLNGFLCLRWSAQIYNSIADYERCTEILARDHVFRAVAFLD
ncbi:MAG TPA: aminotransferase class V-fold PLP-dependent enzyme [Rhizomicrobium sp.]|nr:aminotransferase class V-fold PLP-dependent enzyme [Rhizomicrobium sp.]